MTLSKTLLSLTGLAALALAGCSGGGSSMVAAPPMQAPPRLEDQFGAGFGMVFRQDRGAEPGEPAGTDIEALSLTTEPREIS